MFRYLELESSAGQAEARKIVLIAGPGPQSTSVVGSTAKRQCWLLGVPL